MSDLFSKLSPVPSYDWRCLVPQRPVPAPRTRSFPASDSAGKQPQTAPASPVKTSPWTPEVNYICALGTGWVTLHSICWCWANPDIQLCCQGEKHFCHIMCKWSFPGKGTKYKVQIKVRNLADTFIQSDLQTTCSDQEICCQNSDWQNWENTDVAMTVLSQFMGALTLSWR